MHAKVNWDFQRLSSTMQLEISYRMTLAWIQEFQLNFAIFHFQKSPTERLSANAVKTVVDIVLMGTLNTTLTIGKRLIEKEKGLNYLEWSEEN